MQRAAGEILTEGETIVFFEICKASGEHIDASTLHYVPILPSVHFSLFANDDIPCSSIMHKNRMPILQYAAKSNLRLDLCVEGFQLFHVGFLSIPPDPQTVFFIWLRYHMEMDLSMLARAQRCTHPAPSMLSRT